MAVQAQRFLSSRTRWLVFGLLVVVAVYLLAWTPVQTYLGQRQQMQAAEQRYSTLVAANKQLNDRAAQLQSDEEIARLAREQYELVPNGAQAYAVMPPPTTPAPEAAQTKQDKGLWDRLTFWN